VDLPEDVLEVEQVVVFVFDVDHVVFLHVSIPSSDLLLDALYDVGLVVD
jgi:hypothetical protein